MRDLPGRCHELKHDRAGQLALDLCHPFRLIFEPANEPMPQKNGGGLDWSGVTVICVLGVVNYHD
jgi:proteic killer suppression protein